MWSILQDRDGYFWFGINGGGVSRYDGSSFTHFTIKDGLASNEVWSSLQDQEGFFWFGTSNGVSRYDGKTFTTLNAQDGLANNTVRSIYQDQAGHLWFGTQGGGVSRYDGKTFVTFTEEDGLLDNNVWSIFQDREGVYWFGTTRGFTKYRPPEPIPPRIFIDAVVADRRHEDISDLSIASSAGVVAFEFWARSFKTRPEAMVYRYRLKGYEDTWNTTHAGRVEYENLPRGNYTFEVVVVDRDLVYSETPATFALTVHFPYERAGLLTALGIAIILVSLQTVRVVRRDRRLQASNTALSDANKKLFQINQNLEDANQEVQLQTERKSAFLASMSHELRTPMNAIIGFSRLVLRRSGDALPDQQKDNLSKVTESANYLLEMINDLLDLSKIEAGRMDVDVKTFRVETLIASCCATVTPLVKPSMVLNYEVEDAIGEAKTDQGKLRQILINLLSNALKFTEEGEVRVDVSQLDGQMSIAVSDTGTGIPEAALKTIFEEFQQVEGSDQKQKGTGLGLAITRRFSELLGGTIDVESEIDKGSTFTIRVPVVYKGD